MDEEVKTTYGKSYFDQKVRQRQSFDQKVRQSQSFDQKVSQRLSFDQKVRQLAPNMNTTERAHVRFV